MQVSSTVLMIEVDRAREAIEIAFFDAHEDLKYLVDVLTRDELPDDADDNLRAELIDTIRKARGVSRQLEETTDALAHRLGELFGHRLVHDACTAPLA